VRVQASTSGKSEAVISKMVEGRLSKYFEECVLLEQQFIADESIKVKEVVNRWAAGAAGMLLPGAGGAKVCSWVLLLERQQEQQNKSISMQAVQGCEDKAEACCAPARPVWRGPGGQQEGN